MNFSHLNISDIYNPLVEDVLRMLEMVPPEICWFGDPILRSVSLSFNDDDLDDEETYRISDKLIDVLSAFRSRMNIGRGLSAPQIGISKRMSVVYDINSHSYITYINPAIRSHSDNLGVYKEMCLSGLPLAGNVTRPWEIELEYSDLDGKQHIIQADPWLSRIMLHEIDHLDGILFTDRADPKSLSFEFDWARYKADNKLVQLPKS